jgi:Tol biopolymer transport system component
MRPLNPSEGISLADPTTGHERTIAVREHLAGLGSLIRDPYANFTPNGSSRHTVARGFLPAWSPDGSQLAYRGRAKGLDSDLAYLLVLDLRTGRRQQFVQVREPEAAPAWSPDGSPLASVAPNGRWSGGFVDRLCWPTGRRLLTPLPLPGHRARVCAGL